MRQFLRIVRYITIECAVDGLTMWFPDANMQGMNPENQAETLPPIEVPREKLSPEIIDALIEEFVLREGTDYGAVEVSLQKKKEQVEKQLLRDEIKIIFDFGTGSATLVTLQQFRNWSL